MHILFLIQEKLFKLYDNHDKIMISISKKLEVDKKMPVPLKIISYFFETMLIVVHTSDF